MGIIQNDLDLLLCENLRTLLPVLIARVVERPLWEQVLVGSIPGCAIPNLPLSIKSQALVLVLSSSHPS